MFSAPKPDGALIFSHWDVQYADPLDDHAADFEFGFRGDARTFFRWVDRDAMNNSDRDTSRLVPIQIDLLVTPPCVWPDMGRAGKLISSVLPPPALVGVYT